MPIDIGSSDAPVVMGCSPFKTPWVLWAELVGLLPRDQTETEAMKRGRQLESAIREMFYNEIHVRQLGTIDFISASPDTTRWRQDMPFHRSTPDIVMLLDGAFTIVEIKAVIGHPPAAPRPDWLCQTLHQRQGYSEATRQFLVCFGNLQLVWWELPLHRPAMDRVLREEERFLERVIKQDPPPVRAADASILGKAWPVTTKEPVELDAEIGRAAARLQLTRGEIQQKTDYASQLEAQIKAALADHEEGVFPNGGRITWKPYQRKGYTVQDQTVRRLTIKTNGGDE